MEYIDLSKAKIPTSASLFRPRPQQEVKFDLCFRLKRVWFFQGGVTPIDTINTFATGVKMRSRGQQLFLDVVKWSQSLSRSGQEVKIP